MDSRNKSQSCFGALAGILFTRILFLGAFAGAATDRFGDFSGNFNPKPP